VSNATHQTQAPTRRRSTNAATDQYRLLKHAAEGRGLPYSSCRDAALRGEMAIQRLGRAIYVSDREFASWLERITNRGAAQ
jgi:hypothetical protein